MGGLLLGRALRSSSTLKERREWTQILFEHKPIDYEDDFARSDSVAMIAKTCSPYLSALV
jgi:hypothetical protein